MRAKRYEGATMKEVLSQVRRDLGPEAVILEARQCRGHGLAALLSLLRIRPVCRFEVLAAADGDPEPCEMEFGAALERAESRGAAPTNQPGQIGQTGTVDGAGAMGSPRSNGGIRTPGVPSGGSLRATLSVLARESAARGRAAALSPEMADLYALLLDEDVSEETAFRLVSRLGLESPGVPPPGIELRQWAAHAVSAMTPVSGPMQLIRGRRKVVGFIGPTGVGKTTTIAKLAANFVLVEKARVALITADTYRIAAIEQVRTYADIIGVPCEVAYSAKDMGDALAKHADKEVVLIDTAGRSPNNPTRMYELRGMMDAALPEETHLVLSATTRRQDLDNLVERFSGVGFDKVILTKLDESTNIGAVFNVAAKSGKPFSYLTTGQGVPEDIEAATHSVLAQMLSDRWRTRQ
ncbi:MAG: flagellar biosynthesis protein FlhF [Clostridia bacterium]|nr:flagellar biosynthesis protein FlhF [Clostridia bacterium]